MRPVIKVRRVREAGVEEPWMTHCHLPACVASGRWCGREYFLTWQQALDYAILHAKEIRLRADYMPGELMVTPKDLAASMQQSFLNLWSQP